MGAEGLEVEDRWPRPEKACLRPPTPNPTTLKMQQTSLLWERANLQHVWQGLAGGWGRNRGGGGFLPPSESISQIPMQIDHCQYHAEEADPFCCDTIGREAKGRGLTWRVLTYTPPDTHTPRPVHTPAPCTHSLHPVPSSRGLPGPLYTDRTPSTSVHMPQW